MYDELVRKVYVIDRSGLVKGTDYDAKMNEIIGELSSIVDLATTAVFNAVDNKISDISNLVKLFLW